MLIGIVSNFGSELLRLVVEFSCEAHKTPILPLTLIISWKVRGSVGWMVEGVGGEEIEYAYMRCVISKLSIPLELPPSKLF